MVTLLLDLVYMCHHVQESHSDGSELTAIGISGLAERIKTSYMARMANGATTPEKNGVPVE